MESSDQKILLRDVSKFYGEVLGVNRVTLSISPGIVGLVGPNGSGKSTLMNLMTGLLRPTRGDISILGISPDQPRELFPMLGYCTQFDSFPNGFTAWEFLTSFLAVHGFSSQMRKQAALEALQRVNLESAAHRKIASLSKGMRQRLKLAQAISHCPRVLILDEPLNGLDPAARAEMIALFNEFARQGAHLLISTHILHEIELVSNEIIILNGGYVMAEGDIQTVRSEIPEHPIQVQIRCNNPSLLAAQLFQVDHVVEVQIQEDQKGLLVRTRTPDHFYLELNRVIVNSGFEIDSVAPADESVHAVYEYLIDSSENESGVH